MYEVTYTIDGVIKYMNVSAKDSIQVSQIMTNMFGSGRIEIINVRKI